MARRDEFEAATKRATGRRKRIPSAITAHYDPNSGRVVVGLGSDLDVTFSPRSVQGLEPSGKPTVPLGVAISTPSPAMNRSTRNSPPLAEEEAGPSADPGCAAGS